MESYNQGSADAVACISSGLNSVNRDLLTKETENICAKLLNLSNENESYRTLYKSLVASMNQLLECKNKSTLPKNLTGIIYIDNKFKICQYYETLATRIRCSEAEQGAEYWYNRAMEAEEYCDKVSEEFSIPNEKRFKPTEWSCVVTDNVSGWGKWAIDKLEGTDTWRKEMNNIPTTSTGIKNMTVKRAQNIQNKAIENGELSKRLPVPKKNISVVKNKY